MRALFTKHWTWNEVRADIAEDIKFKLRVMGWCLRLILVLVVLMAVTACASAPVHKPVKPEARLILSKKLGFAPQVVTVRILVVDPEHQLYCPRFFWDCGNGQPPATVESDCEPGDSADIYGEQRQCAYGGPGVYEVRGLVTDPTHGPGRPYRELVAKDTVRLAYEGGL